MPQIMQGSGFSTEALGHKAWVNTCVQRAQGRPSYMAEAADTQAGRHTDRQGRAGYGELGPLVNHPTV